MNILPIIRTKAFGAVWIGIIASHRISVIATTEKAAVTGLKEAFATHFPR